jgi:DNA-binding LacI/PurR family transcriptional regulator
VVTLKDIAKKAGVDKSTVSRALSGGRNISEGKKAEVLKIAEKMGYLPNDSAKVLAGKSAKTIGIILPEIDCNYYASVVGAIETKLKERGYSLIIGQTNFDLQDEIHYLKLFLQKKVDGIIFDLYNNEEFMKMHKKIKQYLKIPIVFIESDLRIPDGDVIEIDNTYGVDLAVAHLAGTGAKSIGYISEYLSSRIRMPAFINALRTYGIPVNRSQIKIGKERLESGGYMRMKELLAEKEVPDAVFISYDTMAQGAIKALREEGYKVPEDISIVGFDNIRESEYFSVPLTTVAPPVIEMGKMAVERLLEKIENSNDTDHVHVILKPELIIRGSTKRKESYV